MRGWGEGGGRERGRSEGTKERKRREEGGKERISAGSAHRRASLPHWIPGGSSEVGEKRWEITFCNDTALWLYDWKGEVFSWHLPYFHRISFWKALLAHEVVPLPASLRFYHVQRHALFLSASPFGSAVNLKL